MQPASLDLEYHHHDVSYGDLINMERFTGETVDCLHSSQWTSKVLRYLAADIWVNF